MSYYGKLDVDLNLIGVFAIDEGCEDAAVAEGLVHLVGWAGWPAAPNAFSKLVWTGANVEWMDGRSLTAVRADKWTAIKLIRNELMDAPITVESVTVDGDGASRINVIGAVLSMQLTGEPTRGWICADNVRRVLSAAQLQQIGIAMAARTQALVDIGDALRMQINDPAKTTAAEVEAVAWPA